LQTDLEDDDDFEVEIIVKPRWTTTRLKTPERKKTQDIALDVMPRWMRSAKTPRRSKSTIGLSDTTGVHLRKSATNHDDAPSTDAAQWLRDPVEPADDSAQAAENVSDTPAWLREVPDDWDSDNDPPASARP
jgi:hypothetical protein